MPFEQDLLMSNFLDTSDLPIPLFPYPFPDSLGVEPRIMPFHGKTATANGVRFIVGEIRRLGAIITGSGNFNGLQKVYWINYQKDSNGEPNYHSYFVFEGCVLPGGLMIMGQHWSPNVWIAGDSWGAPFIMWSVGDENWILEDEVSAKNNGSDRPSFFKASQITI